MIITTLVENRSLSEDFANEHGLSLHIETGPHKILFDLGATDLFLENAAKLNVSVSDVDFLVISHGHKDHGGGLKTFLEANTKAEIYIHEQAFEKYYSTDQHGNLKFIGLDEKLKSNDRITATAGEKKISEKIQLFSDVKQKRPLSSANRGLFAEKNGEITADSFTHEQNLLIQEEGRLYLFTGCAHNGIINILEHFKFLFKRTPDYVIGGFHLYGRATGDVSRESIDEIAEYLLDTKAKYYTCHCTGIGPYTRLKAALNDKIDYLKTGSQIVI